MTTCHGNVGGPGEIVQVAGLRRIQQQCRGDSVHDSVGDTGQVAPLDPDVIVDAHPGEDRHLFAPQTRHAPFLTGRKPHLGGGESCTTGKKELPDLFVKGHNDSVWRLAHGKGVIGDPVTQGLLEQAIMTFTGNIPRSRGFLVLEHTVSHLVPALSASAAEKPLERFTIERRDPRPHDVVIAIKYVGICHSDIHQTRNDWAHGIFPMVPGHEIAGIVSSVGSEVTRYTPGDRVGVGCIIDSCRECSSCVAGEEQYCIPGILGTYNYLDKNGARTDGGYSTEIVVDENYVLRIPESVPLAEAAPLLCAGITVFSPLNHAGVHPGMKVGVVGMGGLGHLAVKFAAAMGAEVTVLSQTLSKKDDGLRLGASRYFATSDEATFDVLKDKFDLIINTVSANLNMPRYLGLLTLDGTFSNVGMPVEPIQLTAISLAAKRRSLTSSKIGGIRETQEMLDFCALHNVAAEVEVISVDDVNDAFERVIRSDVRYRFVIDTSTF